MTKAELMEKLAARAQLQSRQAEEVVQVVFEMLTESLQRDDRIELRGFGSFVNRVYGSYRGRNPKTGETVEVETKRIPFFKAGKELKAAVDRGSTERAP